MLPEPGACKSLTLGLVLTLAVHGLRRRYYADLAQAVQEASARGELPEIVVLEGEKLAAELDTLKMPMLRTR